MRYDYSNLFSNDSALRADIHATENQESPWQQYVATHLALSYNYVRDAEITPATVAMETQQLEEEALKEDKAALPTGPIQVFVVEPEQAIPDFANIINYANKDPGNVVIVLLNQQPGQINTQVQASQYDNVVKGFEAAHSRVFHGIEDAVSYLNSLLY